MDADDENNVIINNYIYDTMGYDNIYYDVDGTFG